MKPLLLERTPLWRVFGFGPRWNLRDIMRHKARSLMSLIGTLGCTLLILGSMGMRDTMDSFLALYYDQATNYTTRINLSEDASKDAIEELITKYNGDASGAVGVQLAHDDSQSVERHSAHILHAAPHRVVRHLHLAQRNADVCDSIHPNGVNPRLETCGTGGNDERRSVERIQ